MRGLLLPQLETVVSRIAQCLDLLQIDYALMGGAAVCFMAPHPSRRITADLLTQRLLNAFPADFGPVNQFGHVIPAFRLRSPSGTIQLIELEVFDHASWPQRPQYNIQTATRVTRTINGYPVKIFGAEWLTREKILSQYQRQGPKHLTDIEDIARLVRYCVPNRPELNFDQDAQLQLALASLLRERPRLHSSLRRSIKCNSVFSNW
ncbi:uncharacterized protein N7518_007812 [Penicillium psychrosexuale]|uniref:uncharacterized protein n=1 Tax=Penicillium psychrosexuale TaxID=1002107 RepID=UPI002544DB5B|nr:uncharacterized protein N7518_007812 [Penicillium psychrosexuale]KAJ5790801.1 hypothetical protein N7518_007812 [Penicillium psychrosexuale]